MTTKTKLTAPPPLLEVGTLVYRHNRNGIDTFKIDSVSRLQAKRTNGLETIIMKRPPALDSFGNWCYEEVGGKRKFYPETAELILEIERMKLIRQFDTAKDGFSCLTTDQMKLVIDLLLNAKKNQE